VAAYHRAVEEFKRALRAWVDHVVEVFQSDPYGSVQESGWSRSRWELDENDHFTLRDRPTLGWSHAFLGKVHASSSFQQLSSAAAADPIVAPQLDVVVGTVLARHRMTLEELAGSVLPEPILLNEVPMLSEAEAFQERWARLERFLTEDSVELTAFWPLAGVVVQESPVSLEEGLLLDRSTPDEMDLGLRFGIIPRPFADSPIAALDQGKRFCLRYRYRLPKLVGDEPIEDAAAEAQLVFEQLEKVASDFVEAAALVGAGRFGVLGIMEHESVQLYGQGTRYRPIAEQQLLTFGGQDLVIGPRDAEVLMMCWSRLRADGFRERNRGVSLALRRFAGHGLRKDLDDQVIDLMIAAEALYLSDLGNDKYQGELRNRLALRAAVWTEPDEVGFSRRDVFYVVQSAYDARSSIAHGGQPRPRDIKVRGERVGLTDLIEATRTILRHAMFRAVQAEGDSWPPAWEDVILDRFEGL
jgi:Apea-like HEPN